MAETRTREEHVAWCKQRARDYLDKGEYGNAVASFMGDMQKHDETKFEPGSLLSFIGLSCAMDGSYEAARRYIDGFY